MECSEKGKNGFKWGENGACYLHDGTPEGIAAAKEKCIKQGLAEGGGKLENAAPSIEYLTAFHRFVTGHPHIYSAVKEEIHKRARASAGGQAKARKAQEEDITLEDIISHPLDESPLKVTNAAPISGLLTETDDYIDTSVVIAKEGIFRGTDNEPRFKPFEALQESAQWMLGTPITNGHIPGEIQPGTRKIGQIVSVEARPDKRDIFGTARFFKKHLNEDELKLLKAGSPIDGSIGYRTPIKRETGNFNGEDFVGIETGPFALIEYAILPESRGACSSAQGCGIHQNSAFEEPNDVLILMDGNVRKCPKKTLNEANKMAEDIEALKAEYEKKLNASNEKVTSLEGTVSELTKKIDGLIGEHKTLNAAFENKVKIENETHAAALKAEFKKSLNAAAATEADALWDQVKGMNPMEYEGWKVTNSSKLLNEAEKKEPAGKKNANAAGAFDLQAAQAALWGY